jgi:hypothetical protein
MWCWLIFAARFVCNATPPGPPFLRGGNDGLRWSGGALVRHLSGLSRSASFEPRIAIIHAHSKSALLGRKRVKSRLFLPRSADSGFALLGRFLEKRLRVLVKTRQISSFLPSWFEPIWKRSCASWHFPGDYCKNRCASWEILGVFLCFWRESEGGHKMNTITHPFASNISFCLTHRCRFMYI